MAYALRLTRRAVPSDSFAYSVIDGVLRAVSQGLGRPSRWNGEVQVTKDGLIEAAAHPDGHLTLNQDSVVKVLENADRDRARGRRVNPVHLRGAVDTLVHAGIDLCTGTGQVRDDEGATIAFSEGVTRLLTDSVLDDVIRQIGLDASFPEILQVQAEPSYSVFAAAARPVVRELSRETGMQTRQVLTHLASVDLDQRFAAVSALMAQAQTRETVR